EEFTGKNARKVQKKTINCIEYFRGNVIYKSERQEITHPTVYKLRDHSIIVEVPRYLFICTAESSPFIYFSTFDEHIYILDTQKTEVLARYRIENISNIGYISSVHNGTITVRGWSGNDGDQMVTAQIPNPSNETATESDVDNLRRMEHHTKELEKSKVTMIEEKEEFIRKESEKEKEVKGAMISLSP
ncbi:hypothetical protein PMAYCL1PPCAC_09073, partial [Pristionchus mayeri]